MALDLEGAQKRIDELLSQLESSKQQLEDAKAGHLLTIEGLQNDVTTILIESGR